MSSVRAIRRAWAWSANTRKVQYQISGYVFPAPSSTLLGANPIPLICFYLLHIGMLHPIVVINKHEGFYEPIVAIYISAFRILFLIDFSHTAWIPMVISIFCFCTPVKHYQERRDVEIPRRRVRKLYLCLVTRGTNIEVCPKCNGFDKTTQLTLSSRLCPGLAIKYITYSNSIRESRYTSSLISHMISNLRI